MEQEEIQSLPEMWAVVELFGHQRAAGKLTTQNLGAACLLRLDVPEIRRSRDKFDYKENKWEHFEETVPAHTRFLGVGSIYAINPCSEETVRAILIKLGAGPVQEYIGPTIRALPASSPAEEATESEEVQTVCQDCGGSLIRNLEDKLVCQECGKEPASEDQHAI
jgi:hypothetical protein